MQNFVFFFKLRDEKRKKKGFYNEISIGKVNFQCNFRENDLFREILIENGLY